MIWYKKCWPTTWVKTETSQLVNQLSCYVIQTFIILLTLKIPIRDLTAPLGSPGFHFFSVNVKMSTWWIGTQLCTDFHGSQRMKSVDFGDSRPPLQHHLEADVQFWVTCLHNILVGQPWNLGQTFVIPRGWIVMTLVKPSTFPVEPSRGRNCTMCSTLVYDQIGRFANLTHTELRWWTW